MKSILDRSFRYVPSHATDVRKTFERIRRERESRPAPAAGVVPINRDKKSA
ncbi:MAG TPA: hypothetical protein VE935_19825 [Burkholderiales bacterium]|jgi:hypothetical protein|nr:hypothetical protein [Burkholderiales bacterium]